jgi:methyltransferase FkbM-like protein
MNLFQTIEGADWSSVHERVWDHPGPIVDLGCAPWDWSRVFIERGRKVVGADPLAEPISGTKFPPRFFQGVIGPATGMVSFDPDAKSMFNGKRSVKTVPMRSWWQFCEDNQIEKIAVLKVNIEGGEYALLNSMTEGDLQQIDQIAVSFHDFMFAGMGKATHATKAYLQAVGFSALQINRQYNWCLFLNPTTGAFY